MRLLDAFSILKRKIFRAAEIPKLVSDFAQYRPYMVMRKVRCLDVLEFLGFLVVWLLKHSCRSSWIEDASSLGSGSTFTLIHPMTVSLQRCCFCEIEQL